MRRMPVDELIAYERIRKDAECMTIDKSGHHLYAENPLHIVACMLGFIEENDKMKEQFLLENNYYEWLET